MKKRVLSLCLTMIKLNRVLFVRVADFCVCQIIDEQMTVPRALSTGFQPKNGGEYNDR